MSKGVLWLKTGLGVEYRQSRAAAAAPRLQRAAWPSVCRLEARRVPEKEAAVSGGCLSSGNAVLRVRWVVWFPAAAQAGEGRLTAKCWAAWKKQREPARGAAGGAQVRGDAPREPGALIHTPAPKAQQPKPHPWEPHRS